MATMTRPAKPRFQALVPRRVGFGLSEYEARPRLRLHIQPTRALKFRIVLI